jgi:adenylate kinase family enzyme
MNLIIVSGFPGTGKTTLSKKLVKKYHYSFLSKDLFKEKLFEEYGFKSAEEKKELDKKAEEMFYENLKYNVENDIDTVVDKWLQGINLIEKFISNKDMTLIFIKLTCNPQVACDRYNKRIISGERSSSFVALNRYPVDIHTVFEKVMTAEAMNEKTSRKFDRTGIDNLIEIDTSNIEDRFDRIFEEITEFVDKNI